VNGRPSDGTIRISGGNSAMTRERSFEAPSRHYDFAVAGGGIGGLSCALALARKDFRVAVLERAGSFGELGAGIQMGPNAFAALDHLGVGEAARDGAVFIDHLRVMDSLDGERICSIDVGQDFRTRFGNPYAVIHRADLHRSILDGCRSSANIDLFTDAQVESFAQNDATVSVRVAGGGNLGARALIGADGLRSVIRAQLLDDGEPQVSGHVTYRAVLPLEDMPEELRWNDMTIWCGPGTHVVHYPLRGWKLFNLVVTCHARQTVEAHNEPAEPGEVLPWFSKLCDKPMGLVRTPKEYRRWVLCDRAASERWTDGRVALLGDAAHPMLQYLAQGACMALEDSVSLAESAALMPDDIQSALVMYELDRMQRTAAVQLGSRMMGRFYHAIGAEHRFRKQLLGSMSQAAFRESLAWLYGHDVCRVARASASPGAAS
jgi:2-polyprenyl-6-methoxyphenol hydroxylase-like FAD-dependent oxidoreductase